MRVRARARCCCARPRRLSLAFPSSVPEAEAFAPSLGKNLFQDSQNLCKSLDHWCKLYTTCMSVLSSWTCVKVREAWTMAGHHQRAALPPRRRSAVTRDRLPEAPRQFALPAGRGRRCRLPRGQIFFRRAEGCAGAGRMRWASGRARAHPRVRHFAVEHPPSRLARDATALARRILI